MKKHSAIILLLLVLTSCYEVAVPKKNEPIKGYKPVYLDEINYKNIYAADPEKLEKPGKIYLYQQYVFVNEHKKGVHIIDNSNPTNPAKVKFIHIPGNVDIAIRSGVMYADNYKDLLVIDISDLNNITVLKRIEDMCPKASQTHPPITSFTYFECADPARGTIIDWIETDIVNPKCYVR